MDISFTQQPQQSLNGVLETQYTNTGTEVSEIFETLHEEWSTESPTATVTLKCKWDERHVIISNLLTGMNYPEYPNGASLFGVSLFPLSVNVEPMPTSYDQNGQGIEYKYAKITIRYQTLEPQVSYQNTSEYWTLNHGDFKYLVDGQLVQVPPEQAPGFLVFGHTMTIQVKKFSIEGFDLTEWENTVNDSELSLTVFGGNGLLRDYPKGTLLCTAPTVNRHAVRGYWDVTFSFSYREMPWNYFFYPQNGKGFQECAVPMTDNNGNELKLFKEKNFKPLFDKIGIFSERIQEEP